MRCIHIPSFEYRRQRWSNGQGWTREILRVGEGEDWAWRCSVAEIDQDGAFSSFPGRERYMVLLHGEGLDLEIGNETALALDPPHGRARYAGESEVIARLRNGPCHALNLIIDPVRCQAELLHRPLVGPMVFFAEPEVSWLIYVLSGRAGDKRQGDAPPAGAGDSLLLAGGETGSRFLLDGAGELLLLRLRALAPDARPAVP